MPGSCDVPVGASLLTKLAAAEAPSAGSICLPDVLSTGTSPLSSGPFCSDGDSKAESGASNQTERSRPGLGKTKGPKYCPKESKFASKQAVAAGH